ncbi:hypothetical protein A0U91_14270 [Acetobacter persici]|uniref:Uncharacterized protein n=1 Tax=Acetobacter persici TaxID=1076596 RepID=A0A1U9LH65_9PROT|nr:hypothetical protein A0U91_14270 [Acetobacter persici]
MGNAFGDQSMGTCYRDSQPCGHLPGLQSFKTVQFHGYSCALWEFCKSIPHNGQLLAMQNLDFRNGPLIWLKMSCLASIVRNHITATADMCPPTIKSNISDNAKEIA